MSETVPAARLAVRKTYKLYIGGAFPRSESGRSYPVTDHKDRFLANAAMASRKDARDVQRQDPVQVSELRGAVVAIPGLRVAAHRTQQPDTVVVAQQPRGDAGDLGKLSDPEHGKPHRRHADRGL